MITIQFLKESILKKTGRTVFTLTEIHETDDGLFHHCIESNDFRSEFAEIASAHKIISILRNMLNRALSYEFISNIPISRYPTVRVDNVRKLVFEKAEYLLLLEECPLLLRRIVIMAHGTGMRQGEILKLK